MKFAIIKFALIILKIIFTAVKFELNNKGRKRIKKTDFNRNFKITTIYVGKVLLSIHMYIKSANELHNFCKIPN